MELRLLPIVVFLSIFLVLSHATLPSEDYWQSKMPNTPMPKAILDLLPSGSVLSSDLSQVRPGSYFLYFFSSAEVRDDPSETTFFLEKDLHPGTTMKLRFTKTTPGTTFLPRQVADVIPFSSNRFSDILQRFSVEPRSKVAQVMKNTIEECEVPTLQGEEKYCATSLESMVDFSTSKLGTNNVQAVSTKVEKKETQKRLYTIAGDVQKMASVDETVVCHRRPYAYAVYYCHFLRTTRVYNVQLVGADGTKANALAMCHIDTAQWNPKYLAFQVLKVKPGTVPVCHFLMEEDAVVWAPK